MQSPDAACQAVSTKLDQGSVCAAHSAPDELGVAWHEAPVDAYAETKLIAPPDPVVTLYVTVLEVAPGHKVSVVGPVTLMFRGVQSARRAADANAGQTVHEERKALRPDCQGRFRGAPAAEKSQVCNCRHRAQTTLVAQYQPPSPCKLPEGAQQQQGP